MPAKYRSFRKLGRKQQHRKLMLRNLVTSLFLYEKICTTEAKAKELRRDAERILTVAKRNDLYARRTVSSFILNSTVVKKIFEVLVPRYAERNSGRLRIWKLPPRPSDSARMCLVKLIS